MAKSAPTLEQLESTIPYTADNTGVVFHNSDALVRGVMGPIGSGSSTMCCMELLSRAKEQKPYRNVRYSRFGIVRDTYPSLLNTTIKTWQDWIPESICHISLAPPYKGHMRLKLNDGTICDMALVFLAMDKPDDIEKLKSLELTGCWFNEASGILKEHFDMAVGRIGRFPSKRRGGPSWRGVILDTNPVDDEHWYYHMAEVECPESYMFLKQPPALLELPGLKPEDGVRYVPNTGQMPGIPAAENIANLDQGFQYYLRQIPGKSREWINVFIMGKYGTTMSGRPIYYEYNDTIHFKSQEYPLLRGIPLILGTDFGLTPATAICQLTPQGQLRVIDEVVSGLDEETLRGLDPLRYARSMGIRQFAKNLLRPYLRTRYHGLEIISIGDPAGNTRGESNETTCLDEMNAAGILTEMCMTNEFIKRREAVGGFMTSMCASGEPAFVISPRVKILRKACMGGYRFRQMNVSGGYAFSTKPEKTVWSHIAEALQYAAVYAESGSTGFTYGMMPGGPRRGPSGMGVARPVKRGNFSAFD